MRVVPVTALLFAAACGPTKVWELPHLPHLEKAPLVSERTLVLGHVREERHDVTPNTEAGLKTLVNQGYGDVREGPGIEPDVRTLDGSPAPTPGPNRKLLGRFVHLADAQLADDESPSRLASFDAIGPTNSAYRPQEAWGCHLVDAAVRTINRIHEDLPLDYVITGGDNADNNQRNEVVWFNAIMDGAPSVECDSGADDDPLLGAANDPKDPFFAEGLHVPWRWLSGNHDVLEQGNFPPTSALNATSTGTDASTGTRDWSRPWGPLTTGEVPADSGRELLDRVALAEAAGQGGDGHGLLQVSATADGKLFYPIDFPGRPLVVIAIDTNAETGGAQGILRTGDVQARVKPLLDAAEARGQYIIVTGHHPARSLGDGSGFAGAAQPDAITPAAWRDFLGGYPHLILQLSGHTHRFRTQLAQPSVGHRYWETETSALADWPAQPRLFEIWDEDNGFLRIRGIPFDYADADDPFAVEARRREAVDYTSGETDGDLNETGFVELWFPKVP